MFGSAEPIRVTDETFELVVVRSPLPVVVDFTATWCAPCRITLPTLRDLSEKLAGRVTFGTVEVDVAAGVSRSYGIHAVPTYLFVHEGRERGREVGPFGPLEFRSKLRRHFAALESPRPRPREPESHPWVPPVSAETSPTAPRTSSRRRARPPRSPFRPAP